MDNRPKTHSVCPPTPCQKPALTLAGPGAANRPDDSYADREFDRFFACAVPTPNGLGLYDPAESPDMPRGADGEAWRRFERDCGRMRRGDKA